MKEIDKEIEALTKLYSNTGIYRQLSFSDKTILKQLLLTKAEQRDQGKIITYLMCMAIMHTLGFIAIILLS